MMLAHTGNAKAPLRDRGMDLYETPSIAIRSLLKVEQLPDCVWEPACGSGNIVKVLREEGHKVIATDLCDYKCPDSECGVDFLFERTAPPLVQTIVTNPPFRLAQKFVAHALELCPQVIMLLRLAFLESEGRTPILEGGHLARVHIFRKRLPMMHRHGWEGPKAASGMAFAWFIWNRDHQGPTTINRI